VDKPVFPPQAEDWRAIDAAQRHVDDKLSALRAYHRRAASSLTRTLRGVAAQKYALQFRFILKN